MEGPNTRALADHLNDVITGRPVEQILVPEHRWQANMLLLNCVGQVVQRVRSHGKWLFFDFSHGVTWLCQLITKSKCFLSPADEPSASAQGSGSGVQGGRRGTSKAVPLLTVHFRGVWGGRSPQVMTLTGRPIFYILPTELAFKHAEIRLLGPDPLSSATFHDDFPYRIRQHPHATVAACLLNQEVVAGLGNLLKCEILYSTRFSPALKVGALLASQVDFLAGTIVGICATASTFAHNQQPFPYRIYDRAGLPCNICQTEIVVDRSAMDGHLTWYCPTCQPVGKEPMLFR